MTRPDTSHWRQCEIYGDDDEDCIVCESRREEFESKARSMCLAFGLPLTRLDLDDESTDDGGETESLSTWTEGADA